MESRKKKCWIYPKLPDISEKLLEKPCVGRIPKISLTKGRIYGKLELSLHIGGHCHQVLQKNMKTTKLKKGR